VRGRWTGVGGRAISCTGCVECRTFLSLWFALDTLLEGGGAGSEMAAVLLAG
jgi:hypothetical protein